MIDVNVKAYLNDLLENHKLLLVKYQKELNKLPEGELGFRAGKNKDGHALYCHYLNGQRIGISKNDELINLLAGKKCLEKAIKITENNIKHLRKLAAQYDDPDLISVAGKFPYHYAVHMNHNEAIWNEKKRLWLAEEFDQSTFNPWEKVHKTAKGLRVRSKSEVIVAERLDYYKIPYRYEQNVYIRQYTRSPDFTILTKSGIKYWEHAGKVNDKGYIRKHNWKLELYGSIGIVPWKNLIITYDNENGEIDTRTIDSEIINKLI